MMARWALLACALTACTSAPDDETEPTDTVEPELVIASDFQLTLEPLTLSDHDPFAGGHQISLWITPPGGATQAYDLASGRLQEVPPLEAGTRIGVLIEDGGTLDLYEPDRTVAYGDVVLSDALDTGEVELSETVYLPPFADPGTLLQLDSIDQSFAAGAAMLDDGTTYLFGGTPLSRLNGGAAVSARDVVLRLTPGPEPTLTELPVTLPVVTQGAVTASARAGLTATPFDDGGTTRILVAGGRADWGVISNTAPIAHIFDPATEAFIEDVALPSGRSDHVAVPLSNGDILLESGLAGNGFGTRRTLWFHAADHTVEELELGDEVGTLYRSAAPLTQGALICGGVDAGVLLAEDWVPVDTCVRLDDDGTVLPAPPLPRPLAGHAMVALPNGDVLVTGGTDQALTPGGAPAQALDVAYRYDAGSNDWETLPDLQHARFGHTAFVLPGGHVAIVGGVEAMGTLFNPESGDPVDCAERFSVDTEQFSAQPGCNGHSAGAFGTVASHPSAGALVFTGFYRGAEGDFLGTRNVGFARPIGPPNP